MNLEMDGAFTKVVGTRYAWIGVPVIKGSMV